MDPFLGLWVTYDFGTDFRNVRRSQRNNFRLPLSPCAISIQKLTQIFNTWCRFSTCEPSSTRTWSLTRSSGSSRGVCVAQMSGQAVWPSWPSCCFWVFPSCKPLARQCSNLPVCALSLERQIWKWAVWGSYYRVMARSAHKHLLFDIFILLRVLYMSTVLTSFPPLSLHSNSLRDSLTPS